MRPRVFLLLLLVILLVPPTSAYSFKVLIFDLPLFLFDVGSDIYNGFTFIVDGNPVWGWIIISVIAVPMTVYYAVYVLDKCTYDGCCSGCWTFLVLLFGTILAPLAIPILTVWYIGYVACAFVFQLGYESHERAGNLKLLEAVGEANLQAVLVIYVTLLTGLSFYTFSKFMQIGGILSSLFSVAKACSEYFLKHVNKEETATWKALLFFAPHVFWRTTAMSFVAAFLKFYSLIPLAIHVLVCAGITCSVNKRYEEYLYDSFRSFALSLLTPAFDNKWIYGFPSPLPKATMLTSSLILLPSLIIIRLLPTLSPENVLCSWGLSHINFDSPIPECSPCFNITTVSTGTPCVMVTTMDDFSSYFFLPLMILGTWCLFEEVLFLCKTPLTLRCI